MHNALLPRFNSRFWSPGCEAADCFTQDWSSDNNWVCPPVTILLKAVNHMKKCRALGTVIVPEWPSAPFWPVLSPKLGSMKKYLVNHEVLPKLNNLCISGRGQCLVYKPGKRLFSGRLPFNLMAMNFDFRNL